MNDLFSVFTSRIEAIGVPYMVTGSVAAMIYGEPRLTHDVDLVIELDDAGVSALVKAFPDEDFYCAPEEVVRLEARRRMRGHFNIIAHATGFKADVYLVGDDPLHRWALEHRHTVEFGGHPLRVAPPEYVILRKLEYFREGGSQKHFLDIRGMLVQLGSEIDAGFVSKKASELGLGDLWLQVQRSGDSHSGE